MDDWENDAEAENPVQTTTSFSGLTVDNLTMSAPTSNTATLTKTGINGNVDVVKYLASMGFDFTQLIDVDGDSYGYLTADGSDSRNATGLSNGEWTTTWNAYGTVKGTSMCSETSGTYAKTGNPSSAEGKYCWCKMTGWTPKGGTEAPAASLWVFSSTIGSASVCAGSCASNCGSAVCYVSGMRSGVFGSVQN
jgi:hypothetical protein